MPVNDCHIRRNKICWRRCQKQLISARMRIQLIDAQDGCRCNLQLMPTTVKMDVVSNNDRIIFILLEIIREWVWMESLESILHQWQLWTKFIGHMSAANILCVEFQFILLVETNKDASRFTSNGLHEFSIHRRRQRKLNYRHGNDDI